MPLAIAGATRIKRMRGLAALLLSAVVGAGPVDEPPAPLVEPPLTGGALLLLPTPQRRAELAHLSRAELSTLFQGTPPPSLVTMCQRGLTELGTYSVRMQKSERVSQGGIERQDIDLTVRPEPLAIRGEFGEGPAQGRRLLYNKALRPEAIRIKERGFFGVFGGVWLDLNSDVMRKQSSRPATDLGFAVPVAHVVHDFAAVANFKGAHNDIDGFDAQGRLCVRTRAPVEAKLFAPDMRICFDLYWGLPVLIESFDKAGLVESFAFDKVRPQQNLAPSYFTLEGADL